jgi:hypothetical protein
MYGSMRTCASLMEEISTPYFSLVISLFGSIPTLSIQALIIWQYIKQHPYKYQTK